MDSLWWVPSLHPLMKVIEWVVGRHIHVSILFNKEFKATQTPNKVIVYLLQRHTILISYHSPSFLFIPVVQVLFKQKQNTREQCAVLTMFNLFFWKIFCRTLYSALFGTLTCPWLALKALSSSKRLSHSSRRPSTLPDCLLLFFRFLRLCFPIMHGF